MRHIKHLFSSIAAIFFVVMPLIWGGGWGCGGGGGQDQARRVVINVTYPPQLQELANQNSLLAEGTLFYTTAMTDGDKVLGPVGATFRSATTLEFLFSDIEDGTYYLRIYFKESSPTNAALTTYVSKAFAKLTAQEECEQDLWSAGGQACIDKGFSEEECRQQFKRYCACDLRIKGECGDDYQCYGERRQEECNREAIEGTEQPSSTSTPSGPENEELVTEPTYQENEELVTEPTYQGSGAPILASLEAKITLANGGGAVVTFDSSQFNLSYDDNGDGITNLDEVVGGSGVSESDEVVGSSGANESDEVIGSSDTSESIDVRNTLHYGTIKTPQEAGMTSVTSPYIISDCYKLSSVSCPDDSALDRAFQSEVGKIGICFEREGDIVYVHQIEWKFPASVNTNKTQMTFSFVGQSGDGGFNQYDCQTEVVTSSEVKDKIKLTVGNSEMDECGRTVYSGKCSFEMVFDNNGYMKTYDTVYDKQEFLAKNCVEEEPCGDGLCAGSENNSNCPADCAGSQSLTTTSTTTSSNPPVPPPPPTAPTGVVVTPGNAKNVIDWGAVDGATSYNIYWSTSSGVSKSSGTKIANVTKPYVHTDLTRGTTYYYLVTAVNSGGEGGESSVVSGTPPLPPVKPSGVEVIHGNSQNTIKWGSVSGATSYNIYWSLSPSVSKTNGTKIENVARPYVHTGLTNGTKYYYVVTGVNAFGESTESTQVVGEPVSPPSAPVGVTAVSDVEKNIISWSNVNSATSYKIYWSKKPNVSSGSTIHVVKSPYTHSELTPGINYYYEITAVNENGESSKSAQVSSMPLVPPPGTKWVERNSGTTDFLSDVAYGDGKFVTVGSLVGNHGTILVSSDGGVTWAKAMAKAISETVDSFRGVAYGNGKFVAFNGYDKIFISPDGVSWSSYQAYPADWSLYLAHPDQAYLNSRSSVEDMTFGNNLFVIVSNPEGDIYTSPDGIAWTKRYSGTNLALSSVMWANDKFVAVGEYGTIITSSDGITWTPRVSGTTNWLSGVAWGNNRFVAVSHGYTNEVPVSPDGINWSVNKLSGKQSLNDITFGGDVFVSCDWYYKYYTYMRKSSDGSSWTGIKVESVGKPKAVTYGGGSFVAVGENGVIITSP